MRTTLVLLVISHNDQYPPQLYTRQIVSMQHTEAEKVYCVFSTRTAPQHTSSYVLSGFAAIFFLTANSDNPEAGRVPVHNYTDELTHHVVKGSKVIELSTEHAQ